MMYARFMHTTIDIPETSTEEDQGENDVNMLAFSPGAHKKRGRSNVPVELGSSYDNDATIRTIFIRGGDF